MNKSSWPCLHAVSNFVVSGSLARVFVMLMVLLAPTSMACDGQKDSGGRDERNTVGSNGGHRSYEIHIPDTEGLEAMPLVIALHGAGDSGPAFKKSSGLDREADRRGVLMAYPTATGVNWAEGCNCTRPDLDGVDDVGYIDAVIADAKERYTVDEDRIYIVGFSQGGLFSQRLACERSTTFAGVATVAGMMSLPVSRACQPSGSPDIMLLHGENDQVLPLAGVPSGVYATLSVLDTFHFWRSRYGCPAGTQTTTEHEGTTREVYRSPVCRDGAVIRTDVMHRTGHVWPSFAPKMILDFFGL